MILPQDKPHNNDGHLMQGSLHLFPAVLMCCCSRQMGFIFSNSNLSLTAAFYPQRTILRIPSYTTSSNLYFQRGVHRMQDAAVPRI
jgi:hypothetical protein